MVDIQNMKKKYILLLLCFIIVISTSFYMRRMNAKKELKNIRTEISRNIGIDTDFVPFLVESSMMYSYAESVANGNGIPKYDQKLGTLSKVPVNQQFSSALEYFLGYSYRLKVFFWGKSRCKGTDLFFEDNPDFSNWVRINIALWAACISGIIFLTLIAFRIPLPFAFFGGILHAVSAAGIARYTGQDIVRGNFSLPFITLSFLMAFTYYKKPSNLKLIILGISVFTAMASWDMTQIVFSLWGISEILRILLRDNKKYPLGKFFTKPIIVWSCIALAFIASALIIPYNRAHLLIVSPFLLIIIPIIMVLQIFRDKNLNYRVGITLLSMILTFIIWKSIAMIGGFTGNYSHFASLLYAKIRFMNVKPANPDLLDFGARSVWVPAMHSANRKIYLAFFPISMFFTTILLVISVYHKKIRLSIKHFSPILFFPTFMFIVYGISFFFIVRYHVFAIIFIALLLPMLLYIWSRNLQFFSLKEFLKIIFLFFIIFLIYNILLQLNQKTPFSIKVLVIAFKLPLLTIFLLTIFSFIYSFIYKFLKANKTFTHNVMKAMIAIMACFILITELDGSYFSHRKYEQHFFPEATGLIKWLRENSTKKTFMTDFNLSPLLKNYCHSSIVMQPKFELGETRELYKKFMNLLFHGKERELAQFCYDNNAEYFIFDLGYANSEGIYSPAYMAAAHEIKQGTPVYQMNIKQDRDALRYFYEIPPPPELDFISTRYILFKVISPKDILNAEDYLKQSEYEVSQKHFRKAVILLNKAINSDPKNAEAYLKYMKIFNKPPEITIQ